MSGLDMSEAIRMLANEFFRCFFKGSACILFVVPFTGTDVFEKPAYFFFGFKKFPIQVARIPVY